MLTRQTIIRLIQAQILQVQVPLLPVSYTHLDVYKRQLVEYHLGYDDEYDDEIRQGLEQKLDALMRHELYAKYKAAPSAEEREQARQEYLDRRGVFPDFRW